MTSHSIFVVDDEETIREGLLLALGSRYSVSGFPSAEAAIKQLTDAPDLILLDIGLPGMSGVEALKAIKKRLPDIPVIMITAYEDVATVVGAMKEGAHDYIVKPIQMDGLEVVIQNALKARTLHREVRALQKRYLQENLPCFIGESDTIQDMMTFLKQIASSPDTPVLILGETGTGKELLAGAIHYHSPNFKGEFVPVNCAAIPEELIESEIFGYEKGAFSGASTSGKKGLIENAENGTLFLDEIGDLNPAAQAKLLRFLENGEFYRVGSSDKRCIQTRVVSATNKDLQQMIGNGSFRKDLFFRIGVIQLKVPALNERRDDIIVLARHFLSGFGNKFGKVFSGVSPEAEKELKAHNWSGNVRELKNVMERGVLIGGGPELMPADLGLDSLFTQPEPNLFGGIPDDGIDLTALQDDLERQYIQEALRKTGGNESRAARLLNLNLHTFRYHRKKLEPLPNKSR